MMSLLVGKTKKNMRARKKEERGKNFLCSFNSFFKCSCSNEALSGEQSNFSSVSILSRFSWVEVICEKEHGNSPYTHQRKNFFSFCFSFGYKDMQVN